MFMVKMGFSNAEDSLSKCFSPSSYSLSALSSSYSLDLGGSNTAVPLGLYV